MSGQRSNPIQWGYHVRWASIFGLWVNGLTAAMPPALFAQAGQGAVFEGATIGALEFPVALTAGVRVTFETRAVSSGGDPVFHLLSPSHAEVAVDDNGGGVTAARLVFTPPSSGTYSLIVRARGSSSGGRADLYRDQTLLRRGAVFGGWFVSLEGLRRGEVLEATWLPGATPGGYTLYVLRSDGVGMARYARGSGASGGLSISELAVLGSHQVVLLGTQPTAGGPFRLVRNDAEIPGHDPDRDGLGAELEAALGTCSDRAGTVGRFDCTTIADARDTDGDGISDGWEVLGRRLTVMVPPNVRDHRYLPLPLWGGDARHKDIFLEVDLMQRCAADQDRTMSAATARGMAAYYGDRVEELHPLVAAYRGTVLGNPDQRPGISLHLDTGRRPEIPEDATVFGAWGGHNVVPGVPSATAACGTVGASVSSVWQANLRPERRGVFRYALTYFGGGGQSAEYTLYSSWNMGSAENAAHEFGHSMGLGHSGPAQRPGVADANCKPTYPSLMNYGYYDHQDIAKVAFSDGRGRPALNNTALQERAVLNPTDSRYFDHLEQIFHYNLDREHGHVDWDRDGVFSAGTVRAYANLAPGGAGCEWTRYNNLEASGTSSMRSPAVAHLAGRTYLFFARASDGRLAFVHSASAFNCPKPEGTGCDGATFSAAASRSIDGSGGVTAVRVTLGTRTFIMVVASDAAGRLRETRLEVDAGGTESWSSAVQIAGAPVLGEPSLAAEGASSAYLAYKGTNGRIRTNRFNANGWSGEQLALTADGLPTGSAPIQLPAMSAASSPALAKIYFPGSAIPSIYGAFTNTSGNLNVWRLDSASQLWSKTDALDENPGPVMSRPTLAWVPGLEPSDQRGRTYLMYVGTDSVPRMLISYTKGIGADGVERVGLRSPFDNIWTKMHGLTLLFEPGVDVNLRAVTVRGNQALRFRPKADGIHDFALTPEDDWSVFHVTACRNLIHPTNGDPDPALSDPISCLPITWK